MATVVKKILSGSTNGKPVPVVATATLGTTIHTAVAGTSSWDEIWLWAYNSDSVARTLTFEFGGTGVGNDFVYSLPPSTNGLILVVPGLVLQNSLVLTAFASAASVVNLQGYVNNIT